MLLERCLGSRRGRLLTLILGLLWMMAAAARADWTGNGFPVAPQWPNQDEPIAVADGQGGMVVAWKDDRSTPFGEIARWWDIYAQRITAEGTVAPGWPITGAPVCAAPKEQGQQRLIRDAGGDYIFVWADARGDAPDIYAQRLTPSGMVAAGWDSMGMPVCTAANQQFLPRIASDGAGGCFISWTDQRVPIPLIYVQRLTPAGTPAPGWPDGGRPVSSLVVGQEYADLAADGLCGALVTWKDYRRNRPRVFAQRVASDGTLTWPDTGVAVCDMDANQTYPVLISDGAGGALVVWHDFRYAGIPVLFAQRFAQDGRRLWDSLGVPVALSPVLSPQNNPHLASDSAGGFIVVWEDLRTDGFYADVFAQRITSAGEVAPGWLPEGVPLATPALEELPACCADGAGGVVAVWRDTRSDGSGDIYAQRLTADGQVAPGWPSTSVALVDTVSTQDTPTVAPDGQGGGLVAWMDNRAGHHAIYAGKVTAGGLVPVLVSLIEAWAAPDRVQVAWHVTLEPGATCTVQRRTPDTPWADVSTGLPDGTGRVAYEDRDVQPGGQYGYRLLLQSPGRAEGRGETWVNVPAALRLAIRGAAPNPASGPLQVRFTLPRRSAATLSLLDVAGRLVLRQGLDGLGAGEHVVVLRPAVHLPAGAYLLRLEQDGAAVTAKAVFMP